MSRPKGIGIGFETASEIVITGNPLSEDPDLPEDDQCRHNCDAMGCSSLSHVLYRFVKPDAVIASLQTIDGLQIDADKIDAAAKRLKAGDQDDAYVMTAAIVMANVRRARLAVTRT